MRLYTALRVLCTCLIVWTAGALPASSATRHVVLLFDERPLDLPGLAALDADLVSTLMSSSADRIEVYREAMDLSRFGSDSYKIHLADFLRTKYADKKIDAAVAIIWPALDFLLNHGDAIFPGTPIVFCAIDKREVGDRLLPPHVRGIFVKREFAPTLELALSLHPQTKRVVVVAGTSEFDTRLLEDARKEFRVYEDRLAFTYLTALPLQKLLTELSQLPPQTIVLFTTYFRDGAGESFVSHDVVQLVSTAASAPVYGFIDQYLGRGIVGGSLYSFSTQGTEAAKLVLQVLADSESSKPAFSEVQSKNVLFDWRQMQRWGISASSLPAGSEIRFHDPTAWERYRLQILAICAAIILQAALISWLLYERRYRRRAETLARDVKSELIQMNRFAAAGELSASIAHEINQPLTGIVANASAARRWLSKERPDTDKIRKSLDQIERAADHATSVIKTLRTVFKRDTSDKSLIDINKIILTVLALGKREIEKHQIKVEMELDHQLPSVNGNEVQVQQVVLNLVMNAMEAMHSVQPRILRIQSRRSKSNTVNVSIEDTGTGIKPSEKTLIFKPLFTTKATGMGMGLSICHSIIETHNGRIWASEGVDRGSIFQFELPIAMDKA